MKSLIIGAGEVGKGLHKVIGGKIMDKEPVKGEFDIIHICFPYSKNFSLEVTKYQLMFKPKLTVIHSTVPVGTSKKLGAIHSPIRGVHPYLAKGIKTFVKYVGGTGAEIVAKFFKDKGMKVRVVANSDTTEALKLLDTFQYGVQIWLNKFIHKVCQKHKVDFNIVYKEANQTYNEGYMKLDRPEVVRPFLKFYDEPLNGHCILENAVILWEQTNDNEIREVFNTVLSMGKNIESISSEKPYLNKTWLYCEYWGKGRSLKSIGKEFGVTGENIGSVMKRLGIKARDKKWTEEEDKELEELSKTKTFKEIAKELGKTHDAVRTRAILKGIKSIYNPAKETKKEKTRKKISSTLQGITQKEWEGFKESANSLVRKSCAYQDWRKSVFERDNYTCQECGAKGGYNHAHHKKPFAKFPELRFDIDNGITLCKKCHNKIHFNK